MVNIDFYVHGNTQIDVVSGCNIVIDFNTHGDGVLEGQTIEKLMFGRMDELKFDKLDGITFGEYLNLEELYEK